MMIPLKNDFHSNLTTQISQTLRLALCQTLALSLFFSLVVHLGYSAIIFSLGGVDFFFFFNYWPKKSCSIQSPENVGLSFWSLWLIDLRADVVWGVLISGVCPCCNVLLFFLICSLWHHVITEWCCSGPGWLFVSVCLMSSLIELSSRPPVALRTY